MIWDLFPLLVSRTLKRRVPTLLLFGSTARVRDCLLVADSSAVFTFCRQTAGRSYHQQLPDPVVYSSESLRSDSRSESSRSVHQTKFLRPEFSDQTKILRPDLRPNQDSQTSILSSNQDSQTRSETKPRFSDQHSQFKPRFSDQIWDQTKILRPEFSDQNWVLHSRTRITELNSYSRTQITELVSLNGNQVPQNSVLLLSGL